MLMYLHRQPPADGGNMHEAVIERDAGDGEHIHRWTIEGVYHPLVMSRSWYEPDEGDYTDIEACSLEVLDSDERVVSCRSVRYTDVPADVIERACEIIRGMDAEVCP